MSCLDFFLICPVTSVVTGGLKNVGVPSMVVTNGLVRPPRSNSCAEIFRTGVPEPELPLDPDDMVRVEELPTRSPDMLIPPQLPNLLGCLIISLTK